MSQVESQRATVLVEKEEKEKEAEEELVKAVIIDHGGDSIKVGLSGDDYPRSLLFNKGSNINIERDSFDNKYKNGRNILTLKYPIEHGMVRNWDDMEKIWHHIFYNELRISPDDQKVLLTACTGWNSGKEYYKMTEIMFEKFNVGSIFIAEQAILSLYANGKTTGVVLDCGFDDTHIIPIVEG